MSNYSKVGTIPHKATVFPVSLELQKLIDTGQFDPNLSKLLDQVIVDVELMHQEKNNG